MGAFVKRAAVFLALVGLLGSCGEGRPERMAKGLCACYQPLLTVKNELEPDKEDAGKAFSEKFEHVRAKVQKCVAELQEKEGDIEAPEEVKALMEQLEVECPEVYELMGN